MNINELKELVKHCVYIEKGVTCMSDTYYNDIIQTIENLQSKIDKISEFVDKIYDVMDYRDYPPYLDEIYYTLHPELKEDK